ncbi:hypothetical protein [Lactiplantibacillus plantarum]|uniref:hypothetical protein n=1 Tax=Lactiplantibacillus plantarum TaxID=1590 RepID=UPI00062D3112|nr:hypothetical protein [Lactiplantibacillus plantarum]EKP1542730.1 hypothetical protein [Campylobacter jejuni]DAM85580.1 MAG TPA: hypothetical protein [Caudoviricetes sp.]KLD40431.1 hypothetical protein WU67_15340 [Lactiplantibacillus plantarum]KLD57936.1 hypothetical protein WP50_30030 [Lactiplantibacillus plantarum]KZU34073.1 hypothetical protein Nizo2741_2665 [Lactiplantibacillus plantarum]
MSIKLFTNELSAVYDEPLRKMLITNFETIRDAFDVVLGNQATLNSDQDKINQDLKNIKDDNKTRDANVQAIVNILNKYDVPIQIVNGKVVEITEEGD